MHSIVYCTTYIIPADENTLRVLKIDAAGV